MIVAGVAGFFALLLQGASDRAWQAFLMSFLLFSGMAQGGVLFSVVMHLTRAKWSKGVTPLAESFSAFFPVSLVFYVLLFLGREHVFPWLHHDLHGKAVWLNLPFLFVRDVIGLGVLYGAGLFFVHQAMKCRRLTVEEDIEQVKKKMSLSGVMYAISFAIVVSLLSYDLIMATAPPFCFHPVRGLHLYQGILPGDRRVDYTGCRSPYNPPVGSKTGTKPVSRSGETPVRFLPGLGGFLLLPAGGDLVWEYSRRDPLFAVADPDTALAGTGLVCVHRLFYNAFYHPAEQRGENQAENDDRHLYHPHHGIMAGASAVSGARAFSQRRYTSPRTFRRPDIYRFFWV